jgi:hypothetical protein
MNTISRFGKIGILFCLGFVGAEILAQTPETGELVNK